MLLEMGGIDVGARVADYWSAQTARCWGSVGNAGWVGPAPDVVSRA